MNKKIIIIIFIIIVLISTFGYFYTHTIPKPVNNITVEKNEIILAQNISITPEEYEKQKYVYGDLNETEKKELITIDKIMQIEAEKRGITGKSTNQILDIMVEERNVTINDEELRQTYDEYIQDGGKYPSFEEYKSVLLNEQLGYIREQMKEEIKKELLKQYGVSPWEKTIKHKYRLK